MSNRKVLQTSAADELSAPIGHVESPITPGQATQVGDRATQDGAPTSVEHTPHAELERGYVKTMNALLENAVEQRELRLFVDVVTWKLAAVGHYYGPKATSDILQKLGGHLTSMAEASDAQSAADAAKKAGHKPN